MFAPKSMTNSNLLCMLTLSLYTCFSTTSSNVSKSDVPGRSHNGPTTGHLSQNCTGLGVPSSCFDKTSLRYRHADRGGMYRRSSRRSVTVQGMRILILEVLPCSANNANDSITQRVAPSKRSY